MRKNTLYQVAHNSQCRNPIPGELQQTEYGKHRVEADGNRINEGLARELARDQQQGKRISSDDKEEIPRVSSEKAKIHLGMDGDVSAREMSERKVVSGEEHAENSTAGSSNDANGSLYANPVKRGRLENGRRRAVLLMDFVMMSHTQKTPYRNGD